MRPAYIEEFRETVNLLAHNQVAVYPIDIRGTWAGGRYRFIQRYRSGHAQNAGKEFDAPFARIDRMGPDRFDILWMRHTGQWWKLHRGVTLAQALSLLETDEVLFPT